MLLDVSPELEQVIQEVKNYLLNTASIEVTSKPIVKKAKSGSIQNRVVYIDNHHYLANVDVKSVRFPNESSFYDSNWSYTKEQKLLLTNIEIDNVIRKVHAKWNDISYSYRVAGRMIFSLKPVEKDGAQGVHFTGNNISWASFRYIGK
jgi:hypothetical protein